MSRERKSELIVRLIAAYRANTSQEEAFDALAAERLGISLTDLRCLDIVEARGGVTAGELAEASGLTTGAITAVADRLTRAGLARRTQVEGDRRKVRVEVTDRHYEETADIWGPLMADWKRSLARRYTTDDLNTIIDFLEEVTRMSAHHAERIRERR